MQTRRVVVADVGAKRVSKRLFIEYEDVVQALPADGTDHAFHVCVLPRRSWRTEDLFDVHDFNLLAELVSVDPIAISQQIPRRALKGEGFNDLLCSPFPNRMGRHIEMKDASAVVREHNKDKQSLERNGV
jgi:hypothetical protein